MGEEIQVVLSQNRKYALLFIFSLGMFMDGEFGNCRPRANDSSRLLRLLHPCGTSGRGLEHFGATADVDYRTFKIIGDHQH
jgi:hypothetical protein